jgi:penicillin V acylase-like amidase (Ntn superfamily)
MRLSLLSKLLLAAFSLATLLPRQDAGACSRIFWNSNGKAMLAARTMDLDMDDSPVLYAMPAGITKNGGWWILNRAEWTSKYGSVVTAFWGNPLLLQDNICVEGCNTAGLAFHYLYLEGSQYEERDSRPGVDGGRYGQYLLDNAATVAEALNLISQTQVVPIYLLKKYLPCHLALEDAMGDSAVVEFLGGKMVVYHGSQYTVLTNEPPYNEQLDNLKRYKKFGGELPWPGDVDPMSRFVRASAFLSSLNPQPFLQPNLISCLLSAIRGVSTPFGAKMPDGEDAWPTLWTSGFDLTNKTIYFKHNSAPNNFWIDMSKINFSPGAPVLYLEADRPDLFGEASRFLSPEEKPVN